jgi:hypothetical protein
VRLVLIAWEHMNSEWGRQPDGWSLHSSEDAAVAFIRRYWAGQPKPAPAEFSRPLDRFIDVEISANHPLVQRMMAEDGVRVPQYDEDRLEIEWVTGLSWPGRMVLPGSGGFEG